MLPCDHQVSSQVIKSGVGEKCWKLCSSFRQLLEFFSMQPYSHVLPNQTQRKALWEVWEDIDYRTRRLLQCHNVLRQTNGSPNSYGTARVSGEFVWKKHLSELFSGVLYDMSCSEVAANGREIVIVAYCGTFCTCSSISSQNIASSAFMSLYIDFYDLRAKLIVMAHENKRLDQPLQCARPGKFFFYRHSCQSGWKP